MEALLGRLQVALADRYRLERELDSGGMALVYIARDLRHDRSVAIKVLRPELSAILGGERFLAEIRITANLQHPHVLPLFDSGSADGLLFYVMPYVEGESLRNKLNRERQFSIEEAVRIATQVASALDYAHRHRVIHRDIKPENILLQDGEVLVADFGIALAVQQAGGSRLTETGLSLGTPQYMSPEQATGDRQLDGRTDIYSLGAVLYEMLGGEPPHTGPTVQAILAKVLTERPRPLTAIRETAPPHVAAAVDRALARLPADRFASPMQLAEALTHPELMAIPLDPRSTSAQSAQLVSVAKLRKRRVAVIAVGSVIGLVIGFLVGSARRSGPVAEPIRFTVPVGAPQIDQLLGQLPLMALSRDGGALVFTQDGRLHVRQLSSFTSTPLPGTEQAVAPAFSPDGQWLVFGQSGRIRKTPAAGGPIVDIATANFRLGAFWAEDDNIYFSAGLGDRGIWRVPAVGGQPQPVTTLSDSVIEQAHGWPQVLPGGRDLLFTVLGPSGGAEDSRVAVESIEGGNRTTVVEQAVFGRYVRTGYLLYGKLDGTVFAVPYDLAERTVRGTPTPVFDGTTVAMWGGGTLFAVSEQGTLVFVPGTVTRNHVMRLVDRTGREIRQIGSPRNMQTGSAFSPDGQRVAVTAGEPGRIDIWLFSVASGESERFTLALAEDERPVWSPDGRTIMYSSAWSGEARRLFAKSVVERTDARLVRAWLRHVHLTSWSPDGRWLAAFDYHPTNNEDVWAIAADGRDSIAITGSAARELNPVFSPDGRWLAYQSEESGRFEVYVVSFPSLMAKRQVSTNGGRIPRWDPTGEALYFLEADRLMSVPVNPRAGFEVRGTPVSLFTTSAFDYNIAPDGRQFLLLLPNPQPSASSIHVVVNWFGELAKVTSRSSKN